MVTQSVCGAVGGGDVAGRHGRAALSVGGGIGAGRSLTLTADRRPCWSAIAVTSVDLASKLRIEDGEEVGADDAERGRGSAATESVLVAELRISPTMVLCCWAEKRLIAAGSA